MTAPPWRHGPRGTTASPTAWSPGDRGSLRLGEVSVVPGGPAQLFSRGPRGTEVRSDWQSGGGPRGNSLAELVWSPGDRGSLRLGEVSVVPGGPAQLFSRGPRGTEVRSDWQSGGGPRGNSLAELVWSPGDRGSLRNWEVSCGPRGTDWAGLAWSPGEQCGGSARGALDPEPAERSVGRLSLCPSPPRSPARRPIRRPDTRAAQDGVGERPGAAAGDRAGAEKLAGAGRGLVSTRIHPEVARLSLREAAAAAVGQPADAALLQSASSLPYRGVPGRNAKRFHLMEASLFALHGWKQVACSYNDPRMV